MSMCLGAGAGCLPPVGAANSATARRNACMGTSSIWQRTSRRFDLRAGQEAGDEVGERPAEALGGPVGGPTEVARCARPVDGGHGHVERRGAALRKDVAEAILVAAGV